MVEGDDLVLGPVDEHDRRSDVGEEVDVWKLIPWQGASRLEDHAVDRHEGRVQDEAAQGITLLGRSGGQVAGGSRSKGPAVKDDVPRWHLESVAQV